jgi:2-polyprenyl-6-hydroxyphenyl methylase/3-demethylubiquinone-9 3-methyltransferase
MAAEKSSQRGTPCDKNELQLPLGVPAGGESRVRRAERRRLMASTQPKHLYGTGGYGAAKANNTDTYLWQPVLQQLATLPAGSRVLDAGCGNGFFAKRLREKGFDVVGIDLEESGIVHARKLCEDVRFEVASVYDNMHDLFGKFDAVVSLEVVEHLYDPRTFVARVHECLRPTGMFILSTPYHGYLKNVLIALSGKFDSHVSPLWDGGHIKFWSRRTLSKLLEEKGFRVEAYIGAGRLPYLWKSMILAAAPL